MSLAICLQHQVESEEKAERLRGLLDDVARVTFLDEPDNRAYCWFRKSSHSTLEGPWIAGFELYDNEAALTTVHRSSTEYQAMRKASAEEQLWGKVYPEIIFLEPLDDSGFVNKDSRSSLFFKECRSTFVVLTRFEVEDADKELLYQTLSNLGGSLRLEHDVVSYLPLVRRDGKSLVVTVFEQYGSEEAYNSLTGNLEPLKSALESPKWKVDITTWSDGIGHIRGTESSKPKVLQSEAPAVFFVATPASSVKA
ncbi:hypothetical protein PV08_03488 [Exophiala spinifera]|uniref:ABM domain-containing protein n=1 Tax=Exophiala spinifera TaxID=91928 RepID=A0A0D2C6J0_9EURO|nr:uncharacterized protein PV08_03488 [Exophiala spinifera]KIW19194.1 hypothetical protein PV08_03488 [Exophiala spinifera]